MTRKERRKIIPKTSTPKPKKGGTPNENLLWWNTWGMERQDVKRAEKELAKMGVEHRMASFAYRKHANTLLEVIKEEVDNDGTEAKR